MIFSLYTLLISSFPLGVLTRFSLTPSVHIYIQDIIIFLILAVSIKKVILYLVQNKNVFLYAFVVLFGISIIGIVTHVNSMTEFIPSFLYLIRLYAYILLLIPLLLLSFNSLQRLKFFMIISGFAYVALGYVQYIFYPNLRNLYYLGWDEHLYRLFGTLLDPNFSGTYILLILLLFFSYVSENFKKSFFMTKMFYVFGLLFLQIAILLTYSRGSYIVSIFSIILFLFLMGYRKLIGVLLLVFGVGIFFLPQNLGGEGVNLLRVSSIFARFDANMQGLLIFVQNPFIGVGYNTLRFVQVDYGIVSPQNALVSHAAAGFPNSYIVLLATMGILGFAVALFIIWNIFKILSKVSEKNLRIFSISVIVSFIGVLLNAFFENTLFYGHIIIWMVLLMGILFGSRKI